MSPFLFNLFSEGLHWILHWIFDRDLIHYLDDFFLVNDPDPEFFDILASYLRLTENIKKRKEGWVVDFTGIELDSEHMIARLPKDKHDRASLSATAKRDLLWWETLLPRWSATLLITPTRHRMVLYAMLVKSKELGVGGVIMRFPHVCPDDIAQRNSIGKRHTQCCLPSQNGASNGQVNQC